MSIQSNFPAIAPSLLLDFANTKQLDNRITFTRSTPAVYYDGKTTAMAEQNLVLYSQSFNGWSQNGSSINLDVTAAPDGTTTADQAVITATTAYHNAAIQNFACVTGLQYTFSLYVKKNVGIESVYFYTALKGGAIAKFNLNDGSYIGNAPSDGYVAFDTVSSVSVGNGWYRVIATITANSTTTTNLTIGFANNTTNTVQPVTGNGTDNFYLWGAQVEQRATATAYTATTTQPITNYIPVLLTAGGNQPRFDCNPTTGESLGLLIEEQRTNLVFRSVYAGGNWTGYGATLTQNYTIAPDASQTACQIFSTGFQTTRIDTGALTGGTTYAVSIWMKSNTSSNQTIALQVGDNLALNCTVTPQWQRFTAAVPPASGGYNFIDLEGTANDISVWGAQLEQASFATSYIPTTGSAATRTADAASMTGNNFSSWYNANEGTMYSDHLLNAFNGTASFFYTLTAGANSNLFQSYYNTATSILLGGSANSTGQFAFTFSSVPLQTKTAVAVKANDFAGTVNGATVQTDTDGIMPVVNTLYIGNRNNSLEFNGTIKKFAYYPIRLSNTNLVALTS